MGGARLEVSVDTLTNFILVAPCYDRIDQPVAAVIGELCVLPSECSQIVGVVWQTRNVVGHKSARGRARLDRVGLQDDRLLDADPGRRPDLRAYFGRVLGRHKIGMRAPSLARGQLQHLRVKRSYYNRDLLFGRAAPENRALQPG